MEGAAPNYRIQTAMVLFALEQAFGEYVQEIADASAQVPSALRDAISARSHRRDPLPADSIGLIVQESYIAELIDLAVELTSDRNDQRHLTRLRAMVEALGVFEIRNAVCHPNRPFHESFWHRIAALATDPAVDALRLSSVVATLRAAQEGKLIPPPDEWLRQKRWSIPNNLPETLDHEITGLIGRQKESQQLLKYLQNARHTLIAVTGPGGCGKTALCLDVLRDCCTMPETTQWADEVIYLTAKTERLTATGIEPIADPIVSLNGVRKALLRALSDHHDLSLDEPFDKVLSGLSSRRVVLFLDNLETLLRDHPPAFDDFVAPLPQAWRVLVTSRVSVNSATVLPIGSMTLEGAKRLARDYLLRRGGERLDEAQLENLANATEMNPLAIRLVLDGVVAGRPLDESLRQTKRDILRFSYANLLEALPPQSVEVLECLFAVGEPVTRSDISSLLGSPLDNVVEAITHLIRTSLLSRQIDGDSERFRLSSAVRDLLLLNPRNVATRDTVNRRLRDQQAALATLHRSRDVNLDDPLAWNYLPAEAPERVKAAVAKVFRAVRSQQPTTAFVALLETVRAAIDRDAKECVLYRALGQLMLKLSDRYSAREAFRTASKCGRTDPSATLRLAELLRDEQRLEESFELSGQLIAEGWSEPDRSSIEGASRVLRAHWVVAIWLGRFDEALAGSAAWESAGPLRSVLGCIRASAWRRSIESERDGRLLAEAFREIFRILDLLLGSEGPVGIVAYETLKSLDAFVWFAKQGLGMPPAVNRIVAEFADRWLLQVVGAHRDRTLGDSETVELLQVIGSLECGSTPNPLAGEKWSSLAIPDPALEAYGYVKAAVYHRPRRSDGHLATYLFAQSGDGTQYYVTRRATGYSFEQFNSIKEGDVLLVVPSDEAQAGTAVPVRDAVLDNP